MFLFCCFIQTSAASPKVRNWEKFLSGEWKLNNFFENKKCSWAYFKISQLCCNGGVLGRCFQLMNDLNHSTQGKKVNTVTACDLLRAFRQKLVESAYPAEEFCEFFLARQVILEYGSLDLGDNIKAEINQHLKTLKEIWKNWKLGSLTHFPCNWRRWELRMKIRNF